MTKLKICGLMSTEDAMLINKAKADYAGIVLFFPKSHRCVDETVAKQILASLDENIKKVAVVVSPSMSQIRTIEALGFDIIQIHKTTDDEVYTKANLPIWKAFNVTDIDSISNYLRHKSITGFVYDAAEPGSGKTFDWDILKSIPASNRSTILAGGINSDNVRSAIDYLNPDVIDISTSVEKDDKTGKDKNKIENFVKTLRNY